MNAKPTRAGAAFGRLAAATTAGQPAPGAEAPGHPGTTTPGLPAATPPGPEPRREPVSRFTVRLWSDDEADRWELLRMRLRRDVGRPVDKAEMVRTLVDLAATDDTVRAALADALRTRPPG